MCVGFRRFLQQIQVAVVCPFFHVLRGRLCDPCWAGVVPEPPHVRIPTLWVTGNGGLPASGRPTQVLLKSSVLPMAQTLHGTAIYTYIDPSGTTPTDRQSYGSPMMECLGIFSANWRVGSDAKSAIAT